MGYLRAKDTVNGALGTCFAIIDGKRHELMQVKNVQAKVKKTRTAIPILGLTAKQQKSGGWEGTGTMTVYYVSSLFNFCKLLCQLFTLKIFKRKRNCKKRNSKHKPVFSVEPHDGCWPPNLPP